jgi:hypothetical protein
MCLVADIPATESKNQSRTAPCAAPEQIPKENPHEKTGSVHYALLTGGGLICVMFLVTLDRGRLWGSHAATFLVDL